MNMFKQLLDKIFFTMGVIIFLQLPYFIDQYTQRIGGYSESNQQQLSDYQSIANNNYDGSLDKLIDSFINSNDTAVRQTGENIQATQINAKTLDHEISVLENDGLFKKVVFLTTNLRIELAKGTLGAFQPGIPLNLWSIIYGLVGGILFSLLFNGFTKIPKVVLKKKKQTSAVFSR